MSALLSWLNHDFWPQVWPNLAASALCTAVAVVRVRVHLRRHREALTKQHAETRQLVAGLHDRLDSLGADPREQP